MKVTDKNAKVVDKLLKVTDKNAKVVDKLLKVTDKNAKVVDSHSCLVFFCLREKKLLRW
ncbi:hypothetical protein SIN01_12020 [Sporolactobacillus inulinus]|nr:hypothetical protein SIN01_12020 [Sporolactobacillus inulinus]